MIGVGCRCQLLFGATHRSSQLAIGACALLALRSLRCCVHLGRELLLDLERIDTARSCKRLLRQGRRGAAAQSLVLTRRVG